MYAHDQLLDCPCGGSCARCHRNLRAIEALPSYDTGGCIPLPYEAGGPVGQLPGFGLPADTEQWIKIFFTTPLGEQWWGWAWTGDLRAQLAMGYAQQNGAPIRMFYQDDRPVPPLQLPTIPGF